MWRHRARRPPKEIVIISHSPIFYWWPVWFVGFLIALLTDYDGHLRAIVPAGTVAERARTVSGHDDPRDVLVPPDLGVAGTVPIQAMPSGPDFPTQNNQRLIVVLIHGASEWVVITTPYFISDESLLQALETAVFRGVDVHLVLSATADRVLVSLAQQSYYEELLEAGVKIHLYRQDFLQAKHLSIDDDIA